MIDFVAGGTKAQPNAVFAGSVPYLMLAGNLVAGWQLARSLLVAQDLLQRDRTKPSCAQNHHGPVLCRPHSVKAPGLRDSIVEGAASVTGWRWNASERALTRWAEKACAGQAFAMKNNSCWRLLNKR